MPTLNDILADRLNLKRRSEQLKAIRGEVDSVLNNSQSYDTLTVEATERLKQTLIRVRKRIYRKQSLHLTPSMVSTLDAPLSNLESSFKSSADEDNGEAIIKQTDDLLDACQRLIWELAAPDEIEDVLQQVTDASQRTTQRLQIREGELEEQQNVFTKALNSASSTAEQVEATVERQKKRLEEFLDAKTVEFAKTISEQKIAADSLTSSQGQQWKAFVQQSKEAFSQYNEKNSKLFEQSLEEQAAASNESIDAIKERLNEARELVGVLADTGLAGHYQTVANQNRFAGNILRGLAVFLFLIPVIVALRIFLTIEANDFRWEVATLRLAGAFAALVPAGYCAKESSRHFAIEQAARQRQLEFSVIAPYLRELEPNDQKEIRKELAKEYFAKPLIRIDSDAGKRVDIGSANTVVDLILKVMKASK